MSVTGYFNHFIILSFIGWIYECTYCTLKTTNWQNRGFLFGPICPIYGAGGMLGYALYLFLVSKHDIDTVSSVAVFAICAAGSAVLEYSTSFILEMLFHARWWDYSNSPLNLNGRICLPATLGFGAAGLIFIKYIFPAYAARSASLYSALPEAAEQTAALAFMMVLGADLALSVATVTSLQDNLNSLEENFDARMETRYAPIGKAQQTLALKILGAGQAIAGRIETMPAYRSLIRKLNRLSHIEIRALKRIEKFSPIFAASFNSSQTERQDISGAEEKKQESTGCGS
ncbi:MAG: putative ABC transporter permease [Lachnospiraceae bacterium]|nr:putative ABC transporter permease [Lachnospiraceae bacterium]